MRKPAPSLGVMNMDRFVFFYMPTSRAYLSIEIAYLIFILVATITPTFRNYYFNDLTSINSEARSFTSKKSMILKSEITIVQIIYILY
ncbi:hypothetical protein STEG23_006647, partial [Scotinomys teguina]